MDERVKNQSIKQSTSEWGQWWQSSQIWRKTDRQTHSADNSTTLLLRCG